MESQDSAEARGAGVDALPDEVLVLVFGKLDDGVTLLDVLPLVCKRWCRLARDPDSWAGVRFRFNLKSLYIGDIAYSWELARALLHAPHAPAATAASLELAVSADTEPCPRVLFALCHSRVLVREVHCEFPVGSDILHAYIVPFLQRQRHLRVLRLAVQRSRPFTSARYDGELAGRLPALRELRLHDCTMWALPRLPPLPSGLVGDLVRGAAALRVLDVYPLRGADRDACTELRGLEHVELALQVSDPHRRQASPEFTQRVEAALQEVMDLCLAMRSPLRTAAFKLLAPSKPLSDRHLPPLRKRLQSVFAAQRPNLKVDLTAQDD